MSELAWITGGSSGIGLAVAKSLISTGWRVAVSGRNKANLHRACEILGDQSIPVCVDVTDPEVLNFGVQKLLKDHGPIRALVANAGTNVGKRAWGEVSPSDFQKVVSANLLGVYNSIDAILPAMRSNDGGRIVVMSSFAGWHVTPQPGPAYTSTKLAVRGLVDSLNMSELRNRIVATSLCPGEVATPAMGKRIPPPSPEVLGRMLQEEDIANAVSYILSQPERVAINELVITPTWNNAYNRVVGPSPDYN